MQDWWNDPNYSHGFLIPIITAYLIWEKRSALRAIPANASPWAIPVLGIASLLYIAGQVAGELYTQRISFVMMLAGLVLAFRGMKWWSRIWAPVIYLVLMIPLPYIVYDAIAFPLKLLATKAATVALQHLGQVIYSEGNLLYLPGITLEVADACSGIRSLVSVLALSVVIAKYTQERYFFRFLVVFLSIPVVIATNILRIAGTGLLARRSPELSEGFFHAFSGEAIFLTGLVILFGIAWFLRRFGSARRDRYPRSPAPPPLIIQSADGHDKWRWPAWSAPCILLVALLLGLSATQVKAIPPLRSLDLLPARIGDFVRVMDDTMDQRVVDALGVDHYVMRAYRAPSGHVLWLYIGYFEDQKEGAMIHSPKHCYPGSGWSALSDKVITINLPAMDERLDVNEYLLAKGDDRELVNYWYQSRGRAFASEYADRLFMLRDSLLKRRSDGCLIRISGPAQDLAAAREDEHAFVRSLFPILKDFLPS
jgi:exosortase D (VPLPA-CTERM-specific)